MSHEVPSRIWQDDYTGLLRQDVGCPCGNPIGTNNRRCLPKTITVEVLGHLFAYASHFCHIELGLRFAVVSTAAFDRILGPCGSSSASSGASSAYWTSGFPSLQGTSLTPATSQWYRIWRSFSEGKLHFAKAQIGAPTAAMTTGKFSPFLRWSIQKPKIIQMAE